MSALPFVVAVSLQMHLQSVREEPVLLRSPVRVGGLDGWMEPADPRTSTEAEALTGPDRAVHAARFQVAPSDLRRAFEHPDSMDALAHDLLFKTNPDTLDPTKWNPSFQTWDRRFETMGVAPLKPSDAFNAFWRIVDANRDWNMPLAEARARANGLVADLLARPFTNVLLAHWDNQDDTAFDGLIAVDERTGELRVLMSNDFG